MRATGVSAPSVGALGRWPRSGRDRTWSAWRDAGRAPSSTMHIRQSTPSRPRVPASAGPYAACRHCLALASNLQPLVVLFFRLIVLVRRRRLLGYGGGFERCHLGELLWRCDARERLPPRRLLHNCTVPDDALPRSPVHRAVRHQTMFAGRRWTRERVRGWAYYGRALRASCPGRIRETLPRLAGGPVGRGCAGARARPG